MERKKTMPQGVKIVVCNNVLFTRPYSRVPSSLKGNEGSS